MATQIRAINKKLLDIRRGSGRGAAGKIDILGPGRAVNGRILGFLVKYHAVGFGVIGDVMSYCVNPQVPVNAVPAQVFASAGDKENCCPESCSC